jgi:hypothetical protein
MGLHLKRHLPIVATAVLVAALMSAGPAAARAVYDAVNADKVDGKHAVSAGSTVTGRAGKLVATSSGSGLLPNNIIAKAPDAAKLGGVHVSGFAPTVLHADWFWVTSDASAICPTASFTPTRPSYAVIRIDVDLRGAATTGTTFGVQPAYSTNDGATYHNATPSGRWTFATAAPDAYASTGNSAVVALSAGQAYRFAGTGIQTSGGAGSGDCKVLVEILPTLPGSLLLPPDPPAEPKASQPPQ